MKVFFLIFAVLSALVLASCGEGVPDHSTDDAVSVAVGTPASAEPESAEPVDFSETEDSDMYFTIGDRKLSVVLEDNAAVKELKERLKDSSIVIDMSDYGGWEKVGSFGFSLPTSNRQITTQPCDFVLYQGSQLVIFYGTNSWSYTKLGSIVGVTPEELREILGDGDVTVTLSYERS